MENRGQEIINIQYESETEVEKTIDPGLGGSERAPRSGAAGEAAGVGGLVAEH